MVKIFRRIESKRENIGFICPFCNGYNIFKGPNRDGPLPRKVGPIFIGLTKICS
jgi:hypothetical protein